MKKSRAFRITLLILIAIIAVVLEFYLSFSQSRSLAHDQAYFETKWDTVINGEDYGQVELGNEKLPLANKGDEFIFRNVIPDNIQDHPMFIFSTVHSDIEVLIDGEVVYEYGKEQYDAGKMVGYGYHHISIEREDANKNIEVRLRISENSAFSSLDAPIIVNGDFFDRDFMIQNRIKLAIIMFLILFGIVFMIVSLCIWKRNVDAKRLFAIALFSLSIGIWSLCTTDLFRFFSYDLRLERVMEFASLYLAPACLLGYFGGEIKKENKVRWRKYLVVECTLNLFFVSALFLHLTNIAHLPVLLKLDHILMAIAISLLLIRFVADLIRGNEHNIVLVYGLDFLIIFVMGDLLKYNIMKFTSFYMSDHYDSTIYFGMFVYVGTLIADYSRKTLNHMYKRIREDTLEKMAYTDELTGLYNRHHMEGLMDQIDERKSNYMVVGFDLNNLKRVNDTMGHEVGDDYIRTFGKLLNEVFGNIATVVRIGGDEFEVIIENLDKSSFTIGKYLNRMKEKLDSINKEHADWNMSTAYGMAKYDEPECTSIRQAIKLADERMYTMKNEMKKGC